MSSKNEEISKIYQALPKENPPAHLDEAVLKFAKKNTPLRANGWLRFFAWSLPVALTATLFFVLRPKEEAPMQFAQVELPPSAPEPTPKTLEPESKPLNDKGGLGAMESPSKKSASRPKKPALPGYSREENPSSGEGLGMGGLATRGAQATPRADHAPMEMAAPELAKPPRTAPTSDFSAQTVAPRSPLPHRAEEACSQLPLFSQVTSCTLENSHAAGWTLRLELNVTDSGTSRFDEEFTAWLRQMNFLPQAPNDFTRRLPNAEERLQLEKSPDTVKLKWTFVRHN